MTKHFLTVSVLLFSILLCNQVLANKTVLNASEVNALFSDHTMTVTETQVDPKTGKNETFRAFFSKLGGIRALHPDGSSGSYNWTVDKKGAFCARNNQRWRDGLCGFLVLEQEGAYALYINKRGNQKAKVNTEGRAIFDPRWEHTLTFTDIQAGEHL